MRDIGIILMSMGVILLVLTVLAALSALRKPRHSNEELNEIFGRTLQ